MIVGLLVRSGDEGVLMSIYALALFLHVVGVVGIFAGLAIWLFSAVVLWRAENVEQVRVIAGPTVSAGNVVVGGIVILAAGGFTMAWLAWGIQAAWLDVATVAFVLLAPVGALAIDPRVKAIARLAGTAPDGPLPAALRVRTHDPVLHIGLYAYVVYLLGIVFLMAVKPDLVTSLLVMAAALALGVGSGAVWWSIPRVRRARVRTPAQI